METRSVCWNLATLWRAVTMLSLLVTTFDNRGPREGYKVLAKACPAGSLGALAAVRAGLRHQLADAFAQRAAAAVVAADREDGVVAGQRAQQFRPALRVQGCRHRLRAPGRGLQQQQVLRLADLDHEFPQQVR